MQRMIRTAAAAMLVVAIAALTACGGPSGSAGDDDVYDLIWYNIGGPQKDHDMVIEAVNEITVPEIGVRLDMRYIDWGDYNERMRVIVASGQPYDVAFSSSWANDFVANVQRGAFLPLNDLLEDEGRELYDAVYDPYWEAVTFDGEIFGVPANKELGQQETFVFNTEVVDRLGIELKDSYTFAELEPLLAQAHEADPSIVAYNINNQQGPFPPFDFVLSRWIPVGFDLTTDENTVVNAYTTDEMMDRLHLLREYYNKGYIPAEAPMTAEKQGYNMDANTNWLVRRATYQPFAESIYRGLYGVEVAIRPVNEQPYINTESALGSIQAVSVTSEKPEKVMEFLNMVNTDRRIRNLLAFGIEGVHYELNDDDKLVELPRMNDFRVPDFTLGNLYVTHIKEGEPDNKWQVFQEFNESGLIMPSFGFVFDNTEVRTEIAAISNVSQEFLPALFTGGVDPDEYVERYNKKLQDAGIDRVISELQTQYDAWVDAQ